MMNRKERRAAAHKELKLARKARKAGLPVATTPGVSTIHPNLTSNHGGADALVCNRR
jgi:GT2 family glycosyltransferase